MDNFVVFRCDRSAGTSLKSSGGGVLIAVGKHITVNQELKPSSPFVESVYLSIKLPSTTLFLSGVYIPPQSSAAQFENYCETVDDLINSDPEYSSILLLGDFNLPNINWNNLENHNPSSAASRCIIDLTTTYQLYQRNHIVIDRDVTLDLVFSNNEPTVMPASDPILPAEAIHPALEINFPIYKLRNEFSGQPPTMDLRRCDLDAIRRELGKTLATTYYIIDNVQDFFESFIESIQNTIVSHTPVKPAIKRRFPSWFSPELRQLVIEKKRLHKLYKTSLDGHTYALFSRVRSQCNYPTRICHEKYIKNLNLNITYDVKSFWKFVRDFKNNSTSATEYVFGERNASSSDSICNLFADFFSSVFSSPTDHPPVFEFLTPFNISHCTLKEEDVLSKLKLTNPNKGSGPDMIPPSVLRHCCDILSSQLTVLFNKFLVNGIFPKIWKTSFVVPIHKNSSPADVTNYRPIVIQPALGKIFESLVLDQIADHFKNTLATQQHGFTHGRSTSTNLVLYENQIISAFARKIQVDSIYIDFSKAFDSIDHGILLSKLKGYGISGTLLSWFRSYILDRRLIVKYAGGTSYPFVSTSGVPQGSHIGPFLFSLFLNDLVKEVNVGCLMFADDIKVFTEISCIEDCDSLQTSLNRIEQWCSANNMRINASKCAVMTFHRITEPLIFEYTLCGANLERKSQIKDLGIVFSSDLSPDKHIDYVCGKALKTLGLIIRASRLGLDIIPLKTLYSSLVRSTLEYGVVIWSPHEIGHIERLEKIQRRFLRVIGVKLGFQYAEVSVDRVADLLAFPSLAQRRQLADAIFLRKILINEIDSPELLRLVEFRTSRNTRSLDLFCHCQCSSNYEYYSAVPRLLRVGNLVAPNFDFFNDSESELKRILVS